MIKTKNTPKSSPRVADYESFPGQPPKQLPMEEAVVKGALYNPLNGKELLSLIIRKLSHLFASEEDIDNELREEILNKININLSHHPQFDTEVIGYPRSDISIYLHISTADVNNSLKSNILFKFSVATFPQEEGKGFSGGLTYISDIDWIPNPIDSAINLSDKWNMDDIPPDALRILNDLPVPTAQKIAGSGPDGETTIIDKDQLAPEKQRQAVIKQFGNIVDTEDK